MNEENVILILDASAIINYLAKFGNIDKEAYITASAINEIRSEASSLRIDQLVLTGKLHIAHPDEVYIKEVIRTARRIGNIHDLSNADIETLALALKFVKEGKKAILITDDYSMMNVAYALNIRFKSLLVKPIREYREYIYICQTCHFSTREPPSDLKCPHCGDMLVRRIRRRIRIRISQEGL